MRAEFDPADLEPALPPRDPPARRRGLLPVGIALAAIAGFGGVVWYAYGLATGGGATQAGAEPPPSIAPLIRAETAPTRVRPAEPGGLPVPHQDKLVLNAPQAAGAATIERLIPIAPPPNPTEVRASVAPPPPLISGRIAPEPLPPLPVASIAPPQSSPAAGAAAAPVTQPAVRSTDVPAGQPAPAPARVEAKPVARVEPVKPPESKPAPEKPASARPEPKPRPTEVAAAPAVARAPAAAGSGLLIQLSSLRSEDEVRAGFAKLQAKHPEQLKGLSVRAQKAEVAGRGVFYRMQAGPIAADDARKLCDALKARGQDCVLVK